MPRYRHSYDEDRWAEEKYWNYVYDNCLCEWYEDENGEMQQDTENLCRHCEWEEKKARKRVEEEVARKASPFYAEMEVLRPIIARNAAATTQEERLESTRELFERLLALDTFLAAKPRIREVAENKMKEFRGKKEAEPLLDLFAAFEAFLKTLPNHPKFVA